MHFLVTLSLSLLCLVSLASATPFYPNCDHYWSNKHHDCSAGYYHNGESISYTTLPSSTVASSTTTGTTTTPSSTTAYTTPTSSVTSTTSTSSSSTSAASFSQPTAPFTVISARSGSPIHLLPMNAIDYNFYLGGIPSTYCPNVSGLVCPPPVDVTAFVGTAALDVEVPGGQEVYVAPDGHLGYTVPHSAAIPAGSVIGYTYSKQNGSEFGDMGTDAFGATGFMACPNTAVGYYQVFAAINNATVPNGNISECLGFDALTTDYTGPAAWEYV